jgi:hypothetical protein
VTSFAQLQHVDGNKRHNPFLQQVSFWPDEDLYSSPRSPNVEDDRLSIASQLRKTKSMDASCLDMRSINDATSPMKPLSRAKSDFNLTASTHSLVQGKFFCSLLIYLFIYIFLSPPPFPFPYFSHSTFFLPRLLIAVRVLSRDVG